MRVLWLVVIAIGCGSSRPPLKTLPPGSHRTELDGVDIAYEIRGSGPPCVVMPGGPGLSSSYLRSSAIEQHVTAIYIDPAGTGGSADLPSTDVYSVRRDAQILEALRDQLLIDRWCLIGHSYGGLVVLRYALDHPEHTNGLLLYSTSPTLGTEWQKQAETRMVTLFKDELWFMDANKALAAEATAQNPEELDKAVRGELPLYFAQWSARESEFAELVANMKVDFEVARRRTDDKFDVRDLLSRIRVPTVVVVGDRDFLFGPEVGQWLVDGIKKAKLVTIEQAGHMSHVEQPAKFATAVELLAKQLK
jgi:proline iminopeptidase